METKNIQLKNLTKEELFQINGGYNLLEYLAWGAGYVYQTLSNGVISSGSNSAQYELVHNSGGLKW